MADGSAGSGIDFALAAYREDGTWQVESLPPQVAGDLEALLTVVRQRPGDGGAIGLVSVDEDFFVAVRVAGGETRLLLSDVTAAVDSPLARELLHRLSLPLPDDDDSAQPAGDVSIFADLGLEPMALAAICDDPDLYPDEMLAQVADRLGFGEEYERAVDLALG
ncbi:MAG TPA: tRNA adenosine deaminase-associated protein [Jiangellaceae bacterium]